MNNNLPTSNVPFQTFVDILSLVNTPHDIVSERAPGHSETLGLFHQLDRPDTNGFLTRTKFIHNMALLCPFVDKWILDSMYDDIVQKTSINQEICPDRMVYRQFKSYCIRD